MSSQAAAHGFNSSFDNFLHAPSEAEAERLVAEIVAIHAAPIIKSVLWHRLRFHINSSDTSPDADAEDLYSGIKLDLLRRLYDSKQRRDAEPIRDLHGYVVRLAHNACHDYLRRKYPQRFSLKNKIRYLLLHNPAFALWETGEGIWLCGYAGWKQQYRELKTSRRLSSHDKAENLSSGKFKNSRSQNLNPTELLEHTFNQLESPIEIDELVAIIADLWDVKDIPTISIDAEEGNSKNLAFRDDVVEKTELRGTLQQLWREICELPLRQRVALLLNLRDAEGRDIISLLPLTHTATLRQIAEALEIPVDKFIELWEQLPLDDLSIAQQLNCTRRQVIKLRRAARERLARRMKMPELL